VSHSPLSNLFYLQPSKKNRPSVCDIEIGYRSTNMALLGMLSLKAGRSIEWDGEKGLIKNDPEANKLLERPYREGWKYAV